MQKKAELVPYAVISLVLGAVLMIMLTRLGILFGEDEGRIDEYIIKDTALFLNQIHSLPENIVVNFFYPLHGRIIEVNRSSVTIYKEEDEDIKAHFRKNYAGYSFTPSNEISDSEGFTISKSGSSITINENFDTDSLACVEGYNQEEYRTIEFVFHAPQSIRSEVQRLAGDLESALASRFESISVRSFNQFRETYMEYDLTIILSLSGADEFHGYYHYKNIGNQNIACRILNMISINENIESGKTRLLGIDPLFKKIEGVELPEKAIVLYLGDEDKFVENLADLRTVMVSVLGDI
ncbi:MAG: hypothetical protein ACOCUR_00405 [Nanoarchaeota archaeon]